MKVSAPAGTQTVLKMRFKRAINLKSWVASNRNRLMEVHDPASISSLAEVRGPQVWFRNVDDSLDARHSYGDSFIAMRQ